MRAAVRSGSSTGVAWQRAKRAAQVVGPSVEVSLEVFRVHVEVLDAARRRGPLPREQPALTRDRTLMRKTRLSRCVQLNGAVGEWGAPWAV